MDRPRNTQIAAIFPLLVPGLGQIWINYAKRGAIISIVFAISAATPSIGVH